MFFPIIKTRPFPIVKYIYLNIEHTARGVKAVVFRNVLEYTKENAMGTYSRYHVVTAPLGKLCLDRLRNMGQLFLTSTYICKEKG